MSWIFALLLVGYACSRCVGWARGQMRWRALRATAPEARAPRMLDGGAPRELQQVHAELNELRVALASSEFDIRKAAATDPDALFGQVRSSRYRVAVRRMSWSLGKWLDGLDRTHSSGPEGLRAECDALDRVQLASDWLAREASTIAHSRALEGFELERVQRAAEVMESCRAAIWEWQAAMEDRARLPYRREAADLRVARAV